MAKMRAGVDIASLMQKALKNVQNDVQLAMHREVAEKLGMATSITIQMQMRAKGIRRAKATGTHLKRSAKEQAAANKYGSMMDTHYKTWFQLDMNRTMVFGGQTLSAYKARFRNDGWKNHHYWEKKGPGSGSGNDYPGEHYIEASQKILRREAPKLIAAVARRVLTHPKYFKVKHKVGV